MTSSRSPLPASPAALTDKDRGFMQRVLELAMESRNRGRHPFAAIVVDGQGRIVAECFNNSMPPEGDPTQHAERLAAAAAASRLTLRELAASTLYTNAEPCAMCAGAVYWCNIGRVVYAMSEEDLLQLTGSHEENPTLSLPCREVFARGQRVVEVLGPLPEFEEQAKQAHLGFWS
ncbi:tRNA(Arg) A34 adenosine deaminase TadA [Noviherbaspirillum humi]|uniref:tRNA(Arg) A34 adenosine deaminase TadA n=1 Tax=Noviherbaspirillum humi TaxID=1688639 RepID=A0A239HUJ2_9BURK|nr:nucleoside deaminase [Noviherbaspirillum humi]SNS85080.1 tRNA(Arg) A34 adenosine deaminase TadA [Noviherbaspirillum humi]